VEGILEKAAVRRAAEAITKSGMLGEIKVLSESARTALDAANALGIQVGQIASSIVFKLPNGNPLLIITSGRHRVNTELVARELGIEELGRADADYVKSISGYSVGGVAPIGWMNQPELTLIDKALGDYEIVWAAAGHPHTVFPTNFEELIRVTGGEARVVGD
jgi:prolyl-tRNA editing enzyme YbaK/EbsC (Cys-tRNA(Pro) deacylase)